MPVTPDQASKAFNRMMGLDLPEFLVEAYQLMLGRPVDPEGFRNYFEAAHRGKSRLKMLAALSASEEGRLHSAKIPDFASLVAGFPAFPVQELQLPAKCAAAGLRELLSLDDVPFVECAFRTMMGRRPGPVELVKYLELLRDGYCKMRVIAAVACTWEGRGRAFGVAGVTGGLIRYLIARIWIIGAAYRAISGVESDTPLERRIRRVECMLKHVLSERENAHRDMAGADSCISEFLRSLGRGQGT
jgi:hypothetical protein